MTDLPLGWEWSTVEGVGRLQLGRQRSPEHHAGPHMRPYLRVANVFEDRIDIGDVMAMNFNPDEFERFKLTSGDVLLNEGQSPHLLGRPAIYRGIPADCAFTNSLIRFQASAAVTPEWALAVFRHHMHSRRFMRESRITTNIAHLSLARLRTVEFPVPPLAEQRRIVEALDDHLSRLDVAEANLRTATARTSQLAEQQLREHLASVPTQLTQMGELLREPPINGRSVPTADNGFPVLRLTALRQGAIDIAERKVGDWTQAQAAPFLVQRGDFLVSRGNGSLKLVGRGGLVEVDPDPVAFPDTLIRLRTNPALVDPGFLRLTWNSRAVRNQIESQARTTAGIYKINQQMIRAFSFPLPSLPDQQRIVAAVSGTAEAASRLSHQLNAALAHATALRRSLLEAAFSGRLVPQDPDDEPASVLLARIAADRAALGPASRRRSAARERI